MTTIGGVVFRYLDRLPVVGDKVSMDGLVATVLAMDGHRMAKVHILKGAFDEDADASDELSEEQAMDGPAGTERRSAPMATDPEGGAPWQPEAEGPDAPQPADKQGSTEERAQPVRAADVVALNLPKSKTPASCGPATIRAAKTSERRES